MKLIHVPVADRPECRIALDQALTLADAMAGSVIGCHLRRPRAGSAGKDRGRRILGFHRWAAIAQDMSEMQIEAHREAAEKLFRHACDEREFRLVERPSLGDTRTAEWVYLAGSLDRLFSTIGRIADVTVVSRPDPGSEGPGSDFMLAALLETGKPVIVLPQVTLDSFGKRILIAWNQSIEAARAVTAALPLLTRAESVHIVSAGPASQALPTADALVDYLKHWGVEATNSRTRGTDAAIEVLDVYRREASDLIVMGAYSRGRFRETVFGGVTEDLLVDTQIPVLALHS